MTYEEWVASMRVSIQAAAIVHMSCARMQAGLGPPDVDDMRNYAEEAAALADLWQESLPK